MVPAFAVFKARAMVRHRPQRKKAPNGMVVLEKKWENRVTL
jgi:hypothetical protein